MTVPVWLRGTLVLAVTLAAGVIIGVQYQRSRPPAHDGSGPAAHYLQRHFARELDLDSAQQQAVAAIIARRQEAVDSAWHRLEPHVRATMDSAHREIRALLRPDQAEKYHRMVAQHHP